MQKHQLAINSISTRHQSVEEALQAYHAAGFRNAEWFLGHIKPFLENGTLEDLKQLHEKYEMRCIGGFETELKAFSSAEEIAANHDLLEENARLLSALGGTNLVVGTDGWGQEVPYEEVIDTLSEQFRNVASRIEPTGVSILIEFNWSPFVKSIRTAAEIVRRSGASNLGILFDPAHYHCTPSKFEQLNDETIALIKHVHVDDMRDKPGELSNCNSDRALPGQGCLDLNALFGRIEAGGYNGFFSIEMFSEELWALPAEAAAKQMYDSLLTLTND